jgi:acetyltransferase-like isoleucine patch superfamily enzyme
MSLLQKVVGHLMMRRHEQLMRRACSTDRSARFQRSSRILNNRGDPGAIRIGGGSVIAGELLVYSDCGRIQIGRDCFVGRDSRIWAAAEIQIGDRVLIAHNVNIHDSPSHSLSARERHEHFQAIFRGREARIRDVPRELIRIDDDAWIGYNASVMRGVHIGRGAIVAAGAVVTRDVAPFTIVAGPVATVIGTSLE